jgi:hypothetical protein
MALEEGDHLPVVPQGASFSPSSVDRDMCVPPCATLM